ncbi:MAG: tRNA lysidine(34) synthetase TilS [Chloroherpetonaceae bacterium]|nr:tRNA lysidine(34) synthetase TilS [Chloroherpetonaceae bacterium]
MKTVHKKFEARFQSHLNYSQLLCNHNKILVALSGGSDSVALLVLLRRLSRIHKVHISAAHCNFQLRGKDSDLDAAFCRKLCKKLDIPFFERAFHTKVYAKTHKLSVETAAREIRYNYFEELMKTHGFEALLTAHHLDDHAETVLFNLLRGSSLSGLMGIRAVREDLLDGVVIRPLLPFSKKELNDYLKSVKQRFREDISNHSLEPDRNFVRLKLIPLLEKRFEGKFKPSLTRLASQAEEIRDFLDERFLHFLGGAFHAETGILELPRFNSLTAFEKKECMKRIVAIYGVSPDFDMLERLALMPDLETGKKVQISKQLIAKREREFIQFQLC